MSPILFYAIKDIAKNKRAFAFITIAVALSATNIVLLNGIVDGVNENLVDRAIETSSAHVSVYPDENDKYIKGLSIKEQKLDGLEDIVAYSPRINAVGAILYREKTKSIKIIALDPEKENLATGLLQKIDSGRSIETKDDIMVSFRVADELKTKIGEQATLVFENGNKKVFTIKGILRTGTGMDMNTVIITSEAADDMLNLNDEASIIYIKLADKNIAEEYKYLIAQELGINKVKDWKQEVESIISTSRTFKNISSAINMVGLFASAVGVGVILYITILHKRRQIGIMKAIGMKDAHIFSIYIFEAVIIGIIGVAIGDFLGYAGVKYLEMHPFSDPIAGTMAPKFYWYLIKDASLVSIFTVIIASLYPAIVAARMNIIKAIWEI